MNFTETQIQGMINSLRDDYPKEIVTRELALLELEDLARKGCLLEGKIGYCYGCSANNNCPLNGWEKRHPEYVNDELAVKLRILKAGGEEAYREQQKRIEEAKKKAEEEKNRAKSEDRIDAACKVLQMIKDAKQPVSALMVNEVVDLIRNAKTTKSELEAAVAKFQ